MPSVMLQAFMQRGIENPAKSVILCRQLVATAFHFI
jgi:hypothetical protein